jgi:hypothetical protein
VQEARAFDLNRKQHCAIAASIAVAAAWFIGPSRERFAGWGEDPQFILWLFETVWTRISAHGPLWFFDLAQWRAQLFAGADFGLAYSENQIWAALFTYLPFRFLHSAALTLQLYVVASLVCTYAVTYLWLRSRMLPGFAAGLAAFFATCGWIQSQTGHLQAFCLFTLPLAALALDRLRERGTLAAALLLGASVGWLCGWNLYYFCFAATSCGVALVSDLFRKRLMPGLVLAAGATAALFAVPILKPYLLLDQSLGAHPALESYGLHPAELFARIDSPRLLWPRILASGEPGAMPISWLLLLIAAVRIPKARPWLIAAAVAFWISTGSTLGAWQTLGWLPGVNGLRAIGRVHVLTIVFSLPALGALLEAFPPKLAGLALLLLVAESLPARPAVHLPVEQDRPAPPFALDGSPLLVLPPPDAAAMYSLLPWKVPYQGGYSGFAPPGQELLDETWRRNRDPAAASIAATRPRYVLARSPEVAASVRANERVAREARLVFLGAQSVLFELSGGEPAPLDPVEATAPRTAPSSLELIAALAGTLSIARVDRCSLRIETGWGPLSLSRRAKLQGSEFLTVKLRPGELVFRHRLKRWIDRWPAAVRPHTAQSMQCH